MRDAHPVPRRAVRLRATVRALALIAALSSFLLPPSPRAQAAPPEWSRGAVWYQIFPERFRNGDPTNDPTWSSLEPHARADSARWAVSGWTADWYARAPWELALGPDFYGDGVLDRRYGGDLQGVLDAADHLAALGVDAVYFNPLFHAASLHKYDATSFHHVDPHFGPDPAGDLARMAAEDPADPATWVWTSADRLFLDVVAALHARGIRVVLDGVFNHTGTRFWAFESVRREQRASPHAGWYAVTAWDDPATPDTSEFDWAGWWGYKPLAELADTPDGADLHPGVAAHLFAVTRRWMDPDGDGDPRDGVDGWRLDVAEQVPAGFWRRWTALVRELNPDAVTVAEIWGPVAGFLAETGFHSAMGYSAFAVPVEAALLHGSLPLSALADTLGARAAPLPPATRDALLTLAASHDTDRLASMVVNRGVPRGYDRRRSPRHDSLYAVRAPTPRERELQRLVVALQMTTRGAPMVYYGDEVGVWGADDPDDRKPMPWPHLRMEPEARDPLGRPRTPDAVGVDSTLLAFYRGAIALRRRWPALRRGAQRWLAADDSAGTLAFERALPGQRLVVALNRSDAPALVPLPGHAGPLVPIYTSRGRPDDIPALVAHVYDDGRVEAGYRVPARTLVVYRPVADADIRPRGLDE